MEILVVFFRNEKFYGAFKTRKAFCAHFGLSVGEFHHLLTTPRSLFYSKYGYELYVKPMTIY